MTKKKKQPSPALELILHVWEYACKATPHSWERLNHAMYDSVTLAITGGLEFAIDDFMEIGKQCRPGYWLHIEQAYLMAVGTPNPSAYQALERDLDREPIIADNVEGPAWHHHSTFRNVRGRVAKDCTFGFQGLRPKATSFDNGCVVACTYKPHKKGSDANKVARRFKLTKDDIIADRADRKEREWMLDHSRKAWGDRATNKFIKLLGIKTNQHIFTLPRKKIDAVLKKLGLAIGKATKKAKTP